MAKHTLLIYFESDQLAPGQAARIQALEPQSHVIFSRDKKRIDAECERIDIVAGRLVPADLLLSLPNLRWYHQWGAGANWLTKYPEAIEKDFVITNTSGIHAIPISEHVLMLMLAAAHGLKSVMRAQFDHVWNGDLGYTEFELAGRTSLVVGLGGVGARVAELCAGIGMRVLGVRRNPERPVANVERIVGPDRLHDLLPEADFVVLTLPLTHETRHFIGAPQLAHMKPTAWILNIGRGGTIDEAALIQALRNKTVGGAALDVFETEPLPADSPLWDMENVLITPHCSGVTPHYDERAIDIFLDNYTRLLRGEPLRNVVDKRLGY